MPRRKSFVPGTALAACLLAAAATADETPAVMPAPQAHEIPPREMPILAEVAFDEGCAGPIAEPSQFPAMKGPDYRPGQISHPRLPEKSRKAGEDGYAVVAVLVNERGRVVKVRLNKSTGFPDLDRLAMEHTAKWKLIPGSVDERPVCSWGRIVVRFDRPARTLQRWPAFGPH